MVYTLVCLAVRRNFQILPKTFQYGTFMLPKRLPVTTSCAFLCGDSGKKEPTEKQPSEKSTEKLKFQSGNAQIDRLLDQIKKGKVTMNDFKALYATVIAEGQFKNYTEAPQTVQMVCFGGLIPMLGIPLLTLLTGHAFSSLVFTHLAYGATVLSFIGGSSWLEAISRNEISFEKLTWCITPQLIGWISVVMPIPIGILMTTFGFSVSLVHDVLLTNYPQWMKSMRLILTGGTIISLILMLLFYIIF